MGAHPEGASADSPGRLRAATAGVSGLRRAQRGVGGGRGTARVAPRVSRRAGQPRPPRVGAAAPAWSAPCAAGGLPRAGGARRLRAFPAPRHRAGQDTRGAPPWRLCRGGGRRVEPPGSPRPRPGGARPPVLGSPAARPTTGAGVGGGGGPPGLCRCCPRCPRRRSAAPPATFPGVRERRGRARAAPGPGAAPLPNGRSRGRSLPRAGSAPRRVPVPPARSPVPPSPCPRAPRAAAPRRGGPGGGSRRLSGALPGPEVRGHRGGSAECHRAGDHNKDAAAEIAEPSQ